MGHHCTFLTHAGPSKTFDHQPGGGMQVIWASQRSPPPVPGAQAGRRRCQSVAAPIRSPAGTPDHRRILRPPVPPTRARAVFRGEPLVSGMILQSVTERFSGYRGGSPVLDAVDAVLVREL